MLARLLSLIAISCIASLLPAPSNAQAGYPGKLIRIIVAYPPGGTSDAVARAIAEKLSGQLSQQVIVENRAGAGGSVGIDTMAKSPPDGYTIAFSAISPITLNPHVNKVAYDSFKDVAPVASVMYSPVYVLATAAFTGKDFSDVIAQAKARPGELRLATSGVATVGHLMIEQIKGKAGVDITHIPYKGGAQVISDAAGAQFELVTSNPSPGVNALIQQGRLRVLAVTGPQRVAAMPNAPTLAELGYASANLTSVFGFFAPGKTPDEIVRRLNVEINKAISLPDIQARLIRLDNIPFSSSPEQFARLIRSEYEANAKVVKEANIKAD